MQKLYKIINSNRIELNESEYQKYIEDKELYDNNRLTMLKNQKKQLLKYNLDKTFEDTYPAFKQRNIAIFGTENDKSLFKNFYLEKTTLYNSYLSAIDSCNSENELNSLNLNLSQE